MLWQLILKSNAWRLKKKYIYIYPLLRKSPPEVQNLNYYGDRPSVSQKLIISLRTLETTQQENVIVPLSLPL